MPTGGGQGLGEGKMWINCSVEKGLDLGVMEMWWALIETGVVQHCE